MPINKTQRFDKGDYTLVINRATGEQYREPKEGPSLVRKAVNFTVATAKHVAKGRPQASLDVIKERYEICKYCPDGLFRLIDPDSRISKLADVDGLGTCIHRKCGCHIHPTERRPNKLGRADQKCPRGYWEAVDG